MEVEDAPLFGLRMSWPFRKKNALHSLHFQEGHHGLPPIYLVAWVVPRGLLGLHITRTTTPPRDPESSKKNGPEVCSVSHSAGFR